MHLLSAHFLWLLAPWAALTFWLLWGRRPRINVPFLELWRGPIEAPAARRGMQLPPVAVLFALLAILLGILAAARPFIFRKGASGTSLTLIVDRGLSMSARGANDLRFRETFERARKVIGSEFGSSSVELISAPEGLHTRLNVSELSAAVQKLSPTAVDSRERLEADIEDARKRESGAIVVISDQPIPSGDRVVQISPDRPIRDAGIVMIAAREHPVPQVMVRIRNSSSMRQALLQIGSDQASNQRTIDLPESDQGRDYFVDLPKLGAVISARLIADDDLPFNNTAYLVRQGSSPRVEATGPLAPEMTRMIDAYQTARPASEGSLRLPVLSNTAQVPADAPAVVLGQGQGQLVSGPVQVVAHPITEHVAWDHLPSPLRVTGDPPAGWTPLVTMRDKTLLAIRPTDPKQVWVGFNAPDWPRTADFVVFWTNVFNWAGGGGEMYAAFPLNQWTPQWKPVDLPPAQAGFMPGVYRRSDGALRAFNAPDVHFNPPAQHHWQRQLSALAKGFGRYELAPFVALAAICCLLLCAITWKGSSQAMQTARLRALATSAAST
jgi:hypothetical protein